MLGIFSSQCVTYVQELAGCAAHRKRSINIMKKRNPDREKPGGARVGAAPKKPAVSEPEPPGPRASASPPWELDSLDRPQSPTARC